MTDLEDAFRPRKVWFVCCDELAEERVIAGRADLAIRPAARARYERLRKALPETGEVEFHRAPVRRAQQTAARLRPDLDWGVSEQLAPRAMGAWEGKTWDELRRSDSVRVESFWADFVARAAPGGGEALTEVGGRAESFLTGLTNRPGWSSAVVIASPDVIAAVACTILDVDLKTTRHFDVDPLSVTTATHSWLGWHLTSLNEHP